MGARADMPSEVDWDTVRSGGYEEFIRMRQRHLDLMRFASEFATTAQSPDPGISPELEVRDELRLKTDKE
jgi:hypothetical protein